MNLTNQLSSLEAAGLVRLIQAAPDLEYLFRHALVQDAAYAVLLKADRRRLHQAVGETLECSYGDQLAEVAPVLGHHFDAAGDTERALKYFTLAGDAAARLYANVEAAGLYGRALEIIARETVAIYSEQLSYLYQRRGRTLELSGRYEEALANYRQMQAAARQRGDQAMELDALIARAIIRSTQNPAINPQRGQALAEEALALARQRNDLAAEAKVLWCLLLLHVFTGRAAAGRPYGEQALALAQQFNLRELQALVLHDLWMVYLTTDRVDKAEAISRQGRELLRELGNLPLLAENLSRSALVTLAMGRLEEAIAASDEAFQLGQRINNIESQAISRSLIGLAYFSRGRVDEAVAIFNEAIILGDQTGNVLTAVGARVELGLIYGLLGELDQGFTLVEQSYQFSQKIFALLLPWVLAVQAQLYLFNGEVARAAAITAQLEAHRSLRQKLGFAPPLWIRAALAQGETALAQGEYDRALAVTKGLSADLQNNSMYYFFADTLFLQGRILAAGYPERSNEAYQTLEAARQAAKARSAQASLWPILASLAEMEERRQRPAEAQALWRQAGQIIEEIASHIGSPGLRASFMASPAVRVVLSSEP
ncbi:MAG: tetratricopeptide repeat protein [Chloroflexi bacterium]|nr:tetratricopeptide repeat protein [Chloroflexota bacterium]